MAESAERFVAGRKRAQISGILLAALGIFLLLSLVTHSGNDAPNSSREREESFNWGGRIGAYSSYAAFTAVGVAAYVLPILSFLWSWNRLKLRPLKKDVMRSAGLIGVALFVATVSGLPAYSRYLAFELGGWLGTEASNSLLIPYAGRIGSTVLLTALLAASILLGTDVQRRHFAAIYAAIQHGARSASAGLTALAAGLRHRLASISIKRVRNGTDQTIGQTMEPATSLIRRRTGIEAPPACEESEQQAGDNQPPESEQHTDSPAAVVALPPPARGVGNGGRASDHGAPSQRRYGNGKPPAGGVGEVARTPAGAKGRRTGPYRIPSFQLLDPLPTERQGMEREALLQNAKVLEDALSNFDVTGRVVEVSPGPVVTRYEVEPAAGIKVNRIVTLSDDLARVMSAQGIRIQAPVPGKKVVGVEIANQSCETVYLREIIDSPEFENCDATLPMVLGKTISGEPYIADLAKMPHLLVAGATGAGKSVCINSLISSILFKTTPEQVRLLMVDPKVVELTVYNDIPHLLVPVVTEPKKASQALKWAVAEMESRYQLLAKLSVRNLEDYNRKADKLAAAADESEDPPKSLPYIVIIIDEFADLMLTAPADVETSLMSLAQKSRAVGIHIILATQRPSVNVITGVIKANFPSRIGFQVASKTDSRTILDMNGAERLLGRGDMLFLPSGQGEPIRIHGAFISGEETERLVASIQSCGYEAEEVEVFFGRNDDNNEAEDRDVLFDEAVQVVLEHQQASTSFLQRRMKIGYSRAARLMDELEAARIVGPADGAKPREILLESEDGETGQFEVAAAE